MGAGGACDNAGMGAGMGESGGAAGTSRWMGRAFELARGALGTTSPNPAVGAVVVRDGRIVGEGATQPPGGAHAEAAALREAGERARGAVLYSTLEPCAHQGRTPPCTAAIIEAGVAEVIAAFGDPDGQVDGAGLERLREAGIAVSVGDGAGEAAELYEAYVHHRRTGRPFVTAKFAASLDGRIAATSGDSRWVSGPETLAWAHRQRPGLDAILVGVGTILADDPQLTARPEGREGPVPQPLRVVLDSRGRTPLEARVLADQGHARTLICTTEASPRQWRADVSRLGAETAVLPAAGGRVAIGPLLELLGRERGAVSLLVEGGGEVHGAFFDAGLVDKVQAVIAPMLIGGDAQTAVRGKGAERMADAVRLERVSVERLGSDLLMTGYPRRPADGEPPRLRPAGADDAAGIDALLGVARSPLTASELLESCGEGAVWVAAGPNGIDGVAGVAAGEGDRAELVCLLAAGQAAAGTAERLRDAAAASAEGRGARWLAVAERPETAGLGPRGSWGGLGFRYFRRGEDGAEVCIRRLSGAGEG